MNSHFLTMLKLWMSIFPFSFGQIVIKSVCKCYGLPTLILRTFYYPIFVSILSELRCVLYKLMHRPVMTMGSNRKSFVKDSPIQKKEEKLTERPRFDVTRSVSPGPELNRTGHRGFNIDTIVF